MAGLSAAVADTSRQLDVEVNQRILMLGDVVAAYSDMVDRHDKGLAREHKLAAEKIGMVKCRDLRGGLATDTELRDQLESNIGQHEITLTDLETRQVRSSRKAAVMIGRYQHLFKIIVKSKHCFKWEFLFKDFCNFKKLCFLLLPNDIKL